MARTLTLPCHDGSLAPFTFGAPRSWPKPTAPFAKRVAYAAAHVVADPRREVDVFTENAIDWDATLAFRRHLWQYGFAIAEADLNLRREGNVLGTSQAGKSSGLRQLSLVRDREVITRARADAVELVEHDPAMERHPGLAAMVAAVIDEEGQGYLQKG